MISRASQTRPALPLLPVPRSGPRRLVPSGLRCALVLALVFAALDAGDRPAFAADEASAEAEKLFALRVRTLLEEKCVACHSTREDAKKKGGLDLGSREGLLAGGESGPAVVPGDADASRLFVAASWLDPDLRMPPKEAERLTGVELLALRYWIDGGAPWPDETRVEALLELYSREIRVPNSGGLSREWTERRYDPDAIWAYRPITRPEVPRGSTGPIDHFIERRLREVGLAPAPVAAPRDLIRRMVFDLTGLPPTPELLERMAPRLEGLAEPRGTTGREESESAYRALVDELLEDPAHGEQYARHWLDVARYADSAGFANDFERPNAWRYRDYVIRSFLEDRPFDEFLRQQIAGDEIDPDDSEHLIATGFLRMGPWEQTGMSVAKLTRQQFLDDVTDSVGQTFLAHSLSCARCHDHKFDPVPTRDYYSIQAVFATTQFAERDAPWIEEENVDGFDAERLRLERRLGDYSRELKRISSKTEAAAREWYRERGREYVARGEALRRGLEESEIVPARHGLDAHDLGVERIARKNSTRHRWELDRYRPIAFSVYSGATPDLNDVSHRLTVPGDPLKGTLERTAILGGGDPFSPTEPVRPGVLSAAAGGGEVSIPEAPEGRRRAFAEWLVAPGNPLTARVIANRVWGWHFGRALAGNPSNFGSTGERPTHPELLDWLASELVRSGWSLRHLHRVILRSDAYRRSARHGDESLLAEKDPGRQLLAVFRPRRLAAEEIRDSMLAVSGELVRKQGGIPCRPDIHLEAALQPRMIMGTYAPAYQPNARPEERNRRTIYALKLRGLRAPILEVLNQPSADRSCEARETSTVAPQALSLMNSEESWDRAVAFAARLRREGGADRSELVVRAFQLAFGRPPVAEELAAALAHWSEQERFEAERDPGRREFPTRVVREAKEEVTGETFTFEETLEIYSEYVPDLQAADVDVATRALANLCLVLLNANEFVHVY